ncbi:MAG: peptidase M16 [Chlamydiae bacterium]|nr:peptidase M16 [Chlamydiota bacterium]
MKSIKVKAISFLFLLRSLSFEVQAAEYQVIENKAELPLVNPTFSERKIAKIQLKNGLQAYIISDPNAEKSAVAISIEAGSWQDPKEYPGMAHFLEHMLFMGTAAYPKENEYTSYILDHGGLVNAYTAPDRTVYMFSVNNPAFEGALDRFSHFFIDPLFSRSSIDKELHAVDQEHAKNIENDGWRAYMIFKETGNPDHPNAGFSTGNAKTLSGIPQDALKKWYEKNYSANRMHLVVLSPLPLEELTRLTVQDFSAVVNNQAAIEPIQEKMFSSSQIGHITYVKPIKDLRELSLSWELPKEFTSFEAEKYARLLAYVLENEDQNSFSAVLKREKLAENLSVQVNRMGKGQFLFDVNIDLTTYGVAQIDTVIHQFFQVISKLKLSGIPSLLYDEMNTLAQIGYQYQSRQAPFEYVMNYAHRMVDENLENFPEESLIKTTYNPKTMQEFLSLLSPQSGLIIVMADPKLTGVSLDKKEKWMNAEYAVKELPQSLLGACLDAKPHSQVQIPPANHFVPSSLTLVSSEEKAPLSPTVLSSDTGEKIYFIADNSYKVPEACLYFNIQTPAINGSAKAYVLADLYLTALQEKLSSTLFLAGNAGLHTGFGYSDFGILIKVQGFSEKAPILLKEIFSSLSHVTPSKEEFEIYRQMIARKYENNSKELPVRQASEILSHVLYNTSPTSAEKLQNAQELTYDQFLTFAQKIFKTSYVEGLLYGNLSETQASDLWASLKGELASQPFPPSEQMKKRILLLPEKHGPYRVVQTTERQGNGVILAIEEGSFSFEKRAAQQMLSTALHDDFFDTLRTKQQTAYIAQAWDQEVERELLQLFAVQSSSHEPMDLLARFELFLEDFLRNFEQKISKERFETMHSMLIHTLETPPENLQGMAERLFKIAFDYEGDFAWMEKRIEALKNLTYEKLFTFAKQNLSRQNHRRLAILVGGVTMPENTFHYETVAKDDVKEIGTYITWKE